MSMNKRTEKEEILQESAKSNLDEVLEILETSKSNVGTRLDFDFENSDFKEVDELKEMINRSIEDPEEKYNLFYNGIQKLINKYVTDKKIRKIVNGEKLVFLNRGKVLKENGLRGGDCRTTYAEDMTRIVEIISEWVMMSQDPTELYKKFYDLNEEYGYPHQKY